MIIALEEIAESVDYGVTASACDEPVGPKFLRITDIQNGRVDWGRVPWCKCKAQSSEAARLRRGDIVFARTGATTGKSYLITDCPENAVFASYLIRVRLGKGADSGYVSQFFQTADYWNQITKSARGVAQPGVNATTLKKLQIPLPSLAEQKRIAAILDAADALRAKRRESLAQLDTLLQSTFLDMFGDPVINPKRFPIKNLSEFYINNKEGTKCGPFGSALKKDELVKFGIPVWNMDNIDASGRMSLPFRMWITEEKYRELQSYSVVDGDVLISRAGTVGKMCVAVTDTTESIISTNLIRVRFGPNLMPIYFVSLMTYCKGRVGRLKTGPDGAFTHMSTGVLDKLKFPYPPLSLQRRFAAIVESVERQKVLALVHLAELDTLFASLQSRAFNWEL